MRKIALAIRAASAGAGAAQLLAVSQFEICRTAFL
jgi:hypothetical protein